VLERNRLTVNRDLHEFDRKFSQQEAPASDLFRRLPSAEDAQILAHPAIRSPHSASQLHAHVVGSSLRAGSRVANRSSCIRISLLFLQQ
jgi:hypothetical protein